MIPILIPLLNEKSIEKDTLPPLPKIDARLRTAGAFVREDASVIADVGTDHAYLPVVLLREGHCRFAVATDIHRGPAGIAARNLSAHGIGSDRAAVLLPDGLHGAEAYHPEDVLILGMGGEMIARILDEAPFIRDPSVRLILQPMTHPEILRAYLDEHGFRVVDEALVRVDRIYQVIVAEYDGITRRHGELEQLVGSESLARGGDLCREFLRQRKAILAAGRAGKFSAGLCTASEDRLIAEIEKYLTEKGD